MAVTGHSNLQDVKIYIEKAEQKRLAENAVCQVYFNNLVPKAYGMKKIKNLLILGTFVAAVASTNITAAHASCDEGCTYSRQTITLEHMVALAAKHNDSFEVANLKFRTEREDGKKVAVIKSRDKDELITNSFDIVHRYDHLGELVPWKGSTLGQNNYRLELANKLDPNGKGFKISIEEYPNEGEWGINITKKSLQRFNKLTENNTIKTINAGDLDAPVTIGKNSIQRQASTSQDSILDRPGFKVFVEAYGFDYVKKTTVDQLIIKKRQLLADIKKLGLKYLEMEQGTVNVRLLKETEEELIRLRAERKTTENILIELQSAKKPQRRVIEVPPLPTIPETRKRNTCKGCKGFVTEGPDGGDGAGGGGDGGGGGSE